MTTPLRANLLYDDPGELIAAIPGLLRFTPTDSVVLVTYTGTRSLSLEAVLRMDLPAPHQIHDVARQLRTVALNHDAVVFELVVIGDGTGGADGSDPPDPPDPPGRDLVDEVTEVLDRAGIVCAHAAWAARVTTGQTWWCYEDPECTGQVRDPASSPVAAITTASGAVTYASRADLAAQLAPDPPDALTRRLNLLSGSSTVDTAEAFPFIRATIDTIRDAPELDEATILRLTHALSRSDVRDRCLALCLTTRAPAAERLWTVLTRAAPAPFAAEPASLLAACAYLRGEGALAGVAVDAAFAACPDHTLAHTIRDIMDAGLPPHLFRSLLAESLARTLT